MPAMAASHALRNAATPEATPPVAAAPEAAPPSTSRFRINAGSEVLHAPTPTPMAEPEPVAPPPPVVAAPVEQAKPGDNQGGWFARLKQGLSKTSASLGEGMASLFLGKKAIDDDLLDEIETRLLMADVGVEATTAIIQSLTQKVARKQLTDSGALYKALQEELTALLKPVEQPLRIDHAKRPYVILVVGVNGVGKTTTIGKLAKKLQLDGNKVMLAAGDTFRAAAIEQLKVWGERAKVPVIEKPHGSDAAALAFDALAAARSAGTDVLMIDTAGRLQTPESDNVSGRHGRNALRRRHAFHGKRYRLAGTGSGFECGPIEDCPQGRALEIEPGDSAEKESQKKHQDTQRPTSLPAG